MIARSGYYQSDKHYAVFTDITRQPSLTVSTRYHKVHTQGSKHEEQGNRRQRGENNKKQDRTPPSLWGWNLAEGCSTCNKKQTAIGPCRSQMETGYRRGMNRINLAIHGSPTGLGILISRSRSGCTRLFTRSNPLNPLHAPLSITEVQDRIVCSSVHASYMKIAS